MGEGGQISIKRKAIFEGQNGKLCNKSCERFQGMLSSFIAAKINASALLEMEKHRSSLIQMNTSSQKNFEIGSFSHVNSHKVKICNFSAALIRVIFFISI